ncbi:hypothetical protein [Serratia marcescens]|uniref:hypothetical protein n=1 Tax=Serratia marcescens TaxID=615 RepID=UPI001953BA37|nr:hypothetical protein [Serratia marcescens]
MGSVRTRGRPCLPARSRARRPPAWRGGSLLSVMFLGFAVNWLAAGLLTFLE